MKRALRGLGAWGVAAGCWVVVGLTEGAGPSGSAVVGVLVAGFLSAWLALAGRGGGSATARRLRGALAMVEGETPHHVIEGRLVGSRARGFLVLTSERVWLLDVRGTLRRRVVLGERGDVSVVVGDDRVSGLVGGDPFAWRDGRQGALGRPLTLHVGGGALVVWAVSQDQIEALVRVLGACTRPQASDFAELTWEELPPGRVVEDTVGVLPAVLGRAAAFGVACAGLASLGVGPRSALGFGVASSALYLWGVALGESGVVARRGGALVAGVGSAALAPAALVLQRGWAVGWTGQAARFGWDVVALRLHDGAEAMVWVGGAMGLGVFVGVRVRAAWVVLVLALGVGWYVVGQDRVYGAEVAALPAVVAGLVGWALHALGLGIEATDAWWRARLRYDPPLGWWECFEDAREGRSTGE